MSKFLMSQSILNASDIVDQDNVSKEDIAFAKARAAANSVSDDGYYVSRSQGPAISTRSIKTGNAHPEAHLTNKEYQDRQAQKKAHFDALQTKVEASNATDKERASAAFKKGIGTGIWTKIKQTGKKLTQTALGVEDNWQPGKRIKLD